MFVFAASTCSGLCLVQSQWIYLLVLAVRTQEIITVSLSLVRISVLAPGEFHISPNKRANYPWELKLKYVKEGVKVVEGLLWTSTVSLVKIKKSEIILNGEADKTK